MPKRYEEEINEILHKFDDWPPKDRGRAHQAPPRQPNRPTNFNMFEGVGPGQIMVVGLLLIAAGLILRMLGLRLVYGLESYIGLLGLLLLTAGYVAAVLKGFSKGPGGPKRNQRMWRGHVVDMRPTNRGLGYWWWRFTSSLRRH
jgi:hypothetical protein